MIAKLTAIPPDERYEHKIDATSYYIQIFARKERKYACEEQRDSTNSEKPPPVELGSKGKYPNRPS